MSQLVTIFVFVRLPFSLITELNFGLCPIFVVRFHVLKLNSLLSGRARGYVPLL
jgi:hypothetical protein